MYRLARVESVIIVPDAEAWRTRDAPGGVSLLERQVKQLRGLGFEPPLLLVVPEAEPVFRSDVACAGIVHVAGAGPAGAVLARAGDALPEDFVFLTADRLIDPRVLRALAGRSALTCASGDDGRCEPVGRAGAADVRRYEAALMEHAARLSLRDLDPYVAELRGNATPYLFAVRSATDRARAWNVLLDHVQKRTLDLPGQYFDSPFENFLVRRLAPTAVTPNQITILTLVVALGVGLLFLDGWLRTGVGLALLVGVLDGVDGKLARMKLQTSKLGELEHVGDFLYENFWYLTLGTWFCRATGIVAYWWVGVVMVACDLADSMLYLIVRRRTGCMLDELTPFDTAFRRVAGRRNIYVMVLVAGCLLGATPTAFLVAGGWAVCTVVIHAARAVAAKPPASN